MRIPLATAAIAACLAATLTACLGPTEVKTKPDAKAPASKPAASVPAAPKKPAVAKVGDTLTLKGQNDGEQLAATIVKTINRAKGTSEFDQPADGKRWVGVQLRLVNTGTAVYEDSPSNGLQVADDQGQRFPATFGEIAAGPAMTSALKLPPGEKALGWVIFEVPKSVKIATVQFALDSGFGPQTGQWALR